MAGSDAEPPKATWPIVYGPRPTATSEGSPRLAWALFIALGLPFGLMTILTVLADAGIRIELFRPLWMPWPPEVVKPFLGLAVFAGTLAYLTFRMGHRIGFAHGTGVGLAAARKHEEERAAENARVVAAQAQAESEAPPLPPPPPPDDVPQVEA